MKKVVGVALVALGCMMSVKAAQAAGITIYRLYNPISKEHLYTSSTAERNNLAQYGFVYEGVGWVAPDKGAPVYRLYNPRSGEHVYTKDAYEKKVLKSKSWKDEGIGWYSGGNAPVYRAFNPAAGIGSHNYTSSGGEQRELKTRNWADEGIAWKGIRAGYTDANSFVMRPMTGDYWNYPSMFKGYPNVRNYKNLNIQIDLSSQRLYVKSGGKVLYAMYISTGAAGLGVTPTGDFAIQPERGPALIQYGYAVAKPYTSWSGHGIYLFHSTLLRPDGSVNVSEAQKLGRVPSSHGCIRMTIPDAYWIHNNVPVGTPVRIR